jgi:hypothetical protein
MKTNILKATFLSLATWSAFLACGCSGDGGSATSANETTNVDGGGNGGDAGPGASDGGGAIIPSGKPARVRLFMSNYELDRLQRPGHFFEFSGLSKDKPVVQLKDDTVDTKPKMKTATFDVPAGTFSTELKWARTLSWEGKVVTPRCTANATLEADRDYVVLAAETVVTTELTPSANDYTYFDNSELKKAFSCSIVILPYEKAAEATARLRVANVSSVAAQVPPLVLWEPTSNNAKKITIEWPATSSASDWVTLPEWAKGGTLTQGQLSTTGVTFEGDVVLMGGWQIRLDQAEATYKHGK